ncbi:hypothetical protein [Streptomyces rhizosphaerihabitans]|uniref:hypothetical protein n=1 Tax=Streptomyces rhizosphaerihabitans TaxID=1266770 RepID=UPI0021C21DAD|nr:hypothetical protein [Streptomyces rhizosphaerihabitans]MCT9010323.1 hypothetical protein [Streptomyces rhizosphaerihabitans]
MPSTAADPAVVPYVTQRKGEEAAPDNLIIRDSGPGRCRLYYADEDPKDRDARGVLYARVGWNSLGNDGMPTGEPQWKFMHPHRQLLTMQNLRCQVCTQPARTRIGLIFLAGPRDEDPTQTKILTNQPPVCAKHVRTVAALCPHMEKRPMVLLAQSAPMYGVGGVVYGRLFRGGLQVVAWPDFALPYGDPTLATFLASQMVRRIRSFRVLDVDELLKELGTAA